MVASKPFTITQHAAGQFAPHGNIKIWPEGSVVHYDVTGPFNVEAIKAFGRTLTAMLAHWQPSGPYASFSVWRDSMMSSQEALDTYAKLLANGRQICPQEVINVWFVPPDIEGRLLMLPKWTKIYKSAGYPLEVFADEAQAHECIRSHLQKATPS